MNDALAATDSGCKALEKTDGQVCHIGTAVENIDILLEFLKGLSGQVFHIYSSSQALLKQLEPVQLEGRTLVLHLVEPIYPEQWLFRLSREIAEKRVDEALRQFPDICTLLAIPEDERLRKLAVRRVSLSRLYMELAIFFAFFAQIGTLTGELYYLSCYFDKNDIQHLAHLKHDIHRLSIVVLPSEYIKVKKKSGRDKWREQQVALLENLQQKKSLGMFQGVDMLRYFWIQFLLDWDTRYQDNRTCFPYAQLRLLETLLRKVRIKLFSIFKRLRFLLALSKISLLVRFQGYRIKSAAQLATSDRVLLVTTSLTKNNLGYLSRIFVPFARRLKQSRRCVIFFVNNQDQTLFETFERCFVSDDRLGALFRLVPLVRQQLTSQKLFKVMQLEEFPIDRERALNPQHLLKNTLSCIERLRCLMTLFYYYTKELSFSVLVGVEEDIEILSLIDILKPILGKNYRTIVIPSCLPEYSECYDCVSVDDLCVSMDFVKEIFLEQNVNAKRVHVVGSLEWENEASSGTLPKKTHRLIESSNFVLGVLHQPIFVTMHGQTIYNGLTMNFLEIYQKFLERHPQACILIKPHPRDDLDSFKTYLQGLSPRIHILPKDVSNTVFYQYIDAAISMHSTMVTHAVAHGVPVVSMYRYPDYRRMYEYLERSGCLATDEPEAALNWLACLQTDPIFRESVMQKMRAVKTQALKIPASKRILRLLETSEEFQEPSELATFLPMDETHAEEATSCPMAAK
jgi:hypothetical protein